MSYDKKIDEVHTHFKDLWLVYLFIFYMHLTDVLYILKSSKKASICIEKDKGRSRSFSTRKRM